MYEELANKLYFSKEAADFLGITTQRLNMLVKEGKIHPLKKTASGTIFHIDELKKRKEEQLIFTRNGASEKMGAFLFDNETKREALNFATLMNALRITEQKLDPIFTEFSKMVDVTIPLDNKLVITKYAQFFDIPEVILLKFYNDAYKAFSNLKKTDEIIKRGGEDYPKLLAKTEQAPRFLYLRGKKSLLHENRTVALVGSRQASDRAKDNTKRLAEKLGRNGITIISGLAKGIDVTAHRAALDKGFNTIAVIGTNLNQYYPAENKLVQQEIEKKGLVVSQFSPASSTERWFFPLRNGVMSGLSLATIIMEAGETSGALKQADFAIRQKREVLIPRSALNIPSITWPQKYVNLGAKVVESPNDVLNKLADSNIFKPDKEELYEQQTLDGFAKSNNSVDIQPKAKWIDMVSDGE